jgi:uncharacterized repeat protein (TIGR01451 family)
VTDNSTAEGVRVYPSNTSNANDSMVILPASTVINVDSIKYYSAAYPGGSAITSVTPGTTVYIRAVVSDPFGSFDIHPAGDTPTISITDPTNVVRNYLMTLVATDPLTPSLTKTFEYAYAAPATPTGDYTVAITAKEGTEGTVTHTAYGTMPVLVPPLLTVTKTVSPTPSSNPGQTVTYSTVVKNTSAGTASSVILVDTLSPYTSFGVDSYAGAPFQFVDGSGLAASGVTLGTPVYSQKNGTPWGYTPAATGYDANVINWKIPMIGTMNGWAGGANPYPSFTINYKVLVR